MLRLEFLGGLSITYNDAPVTHFMSAKVPALLAYLAVTQRAHSRDALAALLWGELPDADAKNNLRQTLSNLKKFFAPHLAITRETVAFNADAPYWLDVEEFEKIRDWRLVLEQPENAQSARPRASEIAPHLGMLSTQFHLAKVLETPLSTLHSRISLYRGDFLDGFYVRDAPEFEEWVLVTRTRLRDLALHALETLTIYHMTRGEYRAAKNYAARLVAMDAWREEAHRLLMLCYARLGERSAALAQYKTCREMLRREFGIEPSAETNALYERLRAVSETPRHNLPPQPTPFIGRMRELAALQEKLLQPECRLLTLLGIGGIGKTRLALETSARLLTQGAFLDGVYFVALSAAQTPEALFAAIAHALGLAPSSDGKTQLVNYLRAKEILLLLDNFEQLVESTPLLGELLTGAPHLKLLVTSREKLNTRWEWVVPLEGLEYTDADSPAAQLFVERAQRVEPHFHLDATNRAAVARVCQFVEGMPLALELAAAAVHRHACADIANELEHNLNFLETTLRDVPARQRSMRAVFDYAWEQLSERERAVWCRLSVFHNSWTRDAARVIADASPSELHALADTSLVRASVAAHETRYDMHELARQYAREKLNNSKEADTPRARHADFFAAFAAARLAPLKGAQFKRARAELGPEVENCIAAWEWCMRAPHAQSANLNALLEPLLLMLELNAQYSRGLDLFQRAAARFADAHAPLMPLRARLEVYSGWMLFRLGKSAEALALLEHAAHQFGHADTVSDRALADVIRGANEYGQGNLDDAQKFFARSLFLYEQANDAWGSAGALLNLGEVEFERGNYDAAQSHLTRALTLARAAGILHQLPHILNNLGILALRQKDAIRAEHYFQDALNAARENEDEYSYTTGIANLAETLAPRDPVRAADLNQQAIERMQQFGNRADLIAALTLRGRLLAARGETADAKKSWREAYTFARALNLPARYPAILVPRAQLALSENDFARACAAYAALEHFEPDPDVTGARAALADALETHRQISCAQNFKTRSLQELVETVFEEQA